MIPLNAAEAATLLRQREIEFTRALRQVDHYGRMETLERQRANRIAAEMDALQRQITGDPAPDELRLTDLVAAALTPKDPANV